MSAAFRFPGALESSAEAAALWAYGCRGMVQDGDEIVAYFDAPRELPVPGSWEAADDTDYLAAYYDGLEPVRLGLLVIAPTHRPVELEPGQRPLWLDPGMAFGTGHHETTRLALEALEALDPAGLRVADVGAGSGILAIAADLLGAADAVGIDIDPDTVPVARSNARRNGSRARFLEGSLDELPDRADLIVANLFAELHIQLAGGYRERLAAGGRVLASGVLADKAVPVETAFGAAGLRVTGRRQAGEWVLIEARRDAAGGTA